MEDPPAATAAPEPKRTDEEIIRYRFLTQIAVSRGKPLVSKIAADFVALCAALQSDASSSCDAFYRSLYRDLASLELESLKSEVSSTRARAEQQAYQQDLQDLEQKIAQAHEDLVAKKVELEDAKLKRKQILQYECVRKQVMEHAGRSATIAEIEATRADTVVLRAEIANNKDTLEMRKKQMALLINSVQSLKSSAAEGDEDAKTDPMSVD